MTTLGWAEQRTCVNEVRIGDTRMRMIFDKYVNVYQITLSMPPVDLTRRHQISHRMPRDVAWRCWRYWHEQLLLEQLEGGVYDLARWMLEYENRFFAIEGGKEYKA